MPGALGVPDSTHGLLFDPDGGLITASRAGHFGDVFGVDRIGQADTSRAQGVDIVVRDLAELLGRT
jgi:hypothetical protein